MSDCSTKAWAVDEEAYKAKIHRLTDNIKELQDRNYELTQSLKRQDEGIIRQAEEYERLEQRYQQLAEVAKSLYVLAWSDKLLLMHEPSHGDERIKAADDAMAGYRERLEQLGVNPDD